MRRVNPQRFTTYVVLFLLYAFQQAFAQNKTVSGTITDPTGKGVPGVTVTVKGTKTATQTDANGIYRISAPDNATLVFSSVGFERMEMALAGRTSFDASLNATNANLSEVVVIGYGTARRRDLTGAVSSVSAREFNRGLITAPDQLLQNKVAGLEITNNSGQPGAATTIKIRGNNSIRASNNPLYVIDGVPLDGRTARPNLNLGTNGLGFGTTPESNPLLYINPSDIERMEVLKDASSAAIYGSRGANGVILITLRKGAAGNTRLDFGTNFAVSDYMKKYNVLNAGQFREAIKKYQLSSAYDAGSSVDAQDEIAQQKFSQNYSLAFSGGNESGRFRASFLGSRVNGLLKKSSLDRYIGSFNGQYRFLNNRLTVDFNAIGGHTLENITTVTNTAGSEGNLLSAALIWNPTVAFRDASGKYNLNSNGVANPLALSDAFSDVAQVNSFLANIAATVKLTNSLDYRFLYGINHGTGERLTNIEGFLVGFAGLSGSGYGVISHGALSSQTFTHTLTYRAKLADALNFDALAGYEYWKTDFSNANIAAKSFNTNLDQSNRTPIPYTSTFQNASTQFPLVRFVDPTTELQSVFGRVNFNKSDKYYLTATLRADGSSKFGKNNRYGYFPSVGVKWQISNENFMQGNGFFSNLALRGSWGQTGNQEFPAGASTEQFALTSYNSSNQTIAANPDLKWETTTSYNIGTDFSFAKNRFNVTIDYYKKNTKDILFQTTAIVPAASSNIYLNLPATLTNEGVEFAINGSIINKQAFGLDLNFNIAYNKNFLKDFYDINTGLPLTVQTGQVNGQGVSGTLIQQITNNQPVNVFFLKTFRGFDQSGNQLIDADPVFAGDPNPHTLVGFGGTLRYRKASLNVNSGGAFGYLIYNNTATSVTNINGITSGRNIDLDAYNSAEAKSSGAAASSRFLEKGDYFKLRNVTFSYAFGNIGTYIKNLAAFVSGTNLFVITKFKGFDPEVNVDKSSNNYPSRSIEYIPYPTPRVLSFGFNFAL